MLKNSLFQPSLSFSFNAAVLFIFLFSAFFCFSAAHLFLFLPAFLFFSVHVCPFFQPRNILFSPKQFSLQPKNIFFQPKRFCPNVFQFFSPNVFQFFFSPNVFASAHTTVSASFCVVSAVFLFVGSVFSAPFLCAQHLLFFFLFQCHILLFLPTSKAKNFLFRCFTFLLFE